MSYFPAESLLERYDDRVYLAQFGLQLSEKGILSFKAPALQSVREFGLVKIFTTIIMQVIVIYVAVAFLLIYIIRCAFIYGHRTSKMPTGPPTLPFIGNLHQIPKGYTHIKFTEWAKQYSGLYTLKLGNETMAVITDRRIVRETIDRKSSLYNHRPSSFVSHDLITKGDHLLVMHYGNHWRTFRRLVHQHLNDAMVENEHLPIIDAEAVQLVRDYMLYPKNHMLHSKRFSNSISNSIIFGVRSASSEGEYMNRLYHLMENWSAIMEMGATPPVDIFPWMKYIPERLLGSYISRARSVGWQMSSLYSDVLTRVVTRRERDSSVQLSTFMDRVLDEQEKNVLSPNQLIFIGGVLMEGGSDTTSSLILAIVQAMIHYPSVQRKAQAEIDQVVGAGRSPQCSDLERLPYINMIVKEGHRWRPILPLCFPHALGEDDWVDGKFLPKGTTVIINTWGMHMDPQTHSNPDAFIPERFASHTKLAPEYAAGDWEKRDHYGYGAGRRICPGMHLAERSMFLSIAKLLWAFRFENKVGVDGKEEVNDMDPVEGYQQGFLYCPKPYGCSPIMRSEEHRETIFKEFKEAEKNVFLRFEEG